MNGSYCALYGGIAFIGSSPATVGTWTHLALVRTNGMTTFYVNGAVAATSTLTPNTATGAFGLGINPNGGGFQFLGYLDEVRIFTFAANQFNTNDLLFYAGPPTATISAAGNITATSATLNGTVNANGNDSTSYFSYGIGTYGTITTTRSDPASKTGLAVNATITGLAPGTHYQYLLVAQNGAGGNSSSGTSFTTLAAAPAVTTGQASAPTGTG